MIPVSIRYTIVRIIRGVQYEITVRGIGVGTPSVFYLACMHFATLREFVANYCRFVKYCRGDAGNAVRLHVICEMVLSCRLIRALCARDGLDARVGPHVIGQVAFPRRPVRALCAREGPFTIVRAHVHGEVALLRGPVRALVARVRLDARVNPHVLGQAALASRPVRADRARVHRLDAGVRAHVPCQVPLVLRCVRANCAHVHRLLFSRRGRGWGGALLRHSVRAESNNSSTTGKLTVEITSAFKEGDFEILRSRQQDRYCTASRAHNKTTNFRSIYSCMYTKNGGLG